MAKPLEDYIEVSERIEKFYARYPEGSLRCREIRMMEIGGQNFILYIAQAFRSPDDPSPAEGAAWETVPGATNFTRGSEVMNAETSAWGRAIAALGFEVKKGVASRQEVQQAKDRQNAGASPGAAKLEHAKPPSSTPAAAPEEASGTWPKLLRSRIAELSPDKDFDPEGREEWFSLVAGQLFQLNVKSVNELGDTQSAELYDWLAREAAKRKLGKAPA